MARPLVLEWSWATRGSSYCPVPEIAGILPEVSWLFFKARAKHPYLSHTGRASNAEKQPTGPGPKGCDENGPAAALLVGHVSIQICSLLAPCRRPILIATKYLLFRGQDYEYSVKTSETLIEFAATPLILTTWRPRSLKGVSQMTDPTRRFTAFASSIRLTPSSNAL